MRILAIALAMVIAAAAAAQAADAPVLSPPLKFVVPVKTGTAPAKTGTAAAKAPLRPSLVVWRADLAGATKEAADSGRLVMIYFWARWSDACRLMDSGPFAVPIIATFIAQNCVAVKADDTEEPSAITKKYQVRAYPTILFLGPDGQPLHEVVRPLPAGDLYRIIKQVKAIVPLIEAQRKTPDDLEANASLASAWVGLDQLRRAEPSLRRVAELDPKNEKGRLAWARLLLAVMPVEEPDPQKVAENIAKALKDLDAWMVEFKDSPDVPQAMLFKGKILFNDGQLVEARETFEELRTRYVSSIRAYEADKAIDQIDEMLKDQSDAHKKAVEAEKKAAATATSALGAPPAPTPTAPAPTATVLRPKG